MPISDDEEYGNNQDLRERIEKLNQRVQNLEDDFRNLKQLVLAKIKV